MKCGGHYDSCGEKCPDCGRFQDDCSGHPDYYETDNGDWVEIGGENDPEIPEMKGTKEALAKLTIKKEGK